MTQKYDAAAAMRELRRKRKEQGKCVYSNCDAPLDTKTMCEKHANAIRQKKQKQIEKGLCVYCNEPLNTGTKCEKHSERKYKDSPLRNSGHRYPLERRSKLDQNVMVGSNWRQQKRRMM
ncbi:hypothetical protein ASD24_24335 [Paenibacillus sp. Root52]|nr:hypothetical protein ASD24_24335 [Paenibacillus sp. Root52]